MPTGGDKVAAAVRAGAITAAGKLVPFGDAAAALLSEFFPSRYEQRLDKWREQVTELLRLLSERGIDVEQLRKSDEFANLVVDVTTSAVRTASDLKRNMLRNVLLNSAQAPLPDRAKERMFLRFIDELDELHFDLLAFYADPATYLMDRHGLMLPEYKGPFGIAAIPAESPSSLRNVRRSAFPNYTDQQDVVGLVTDDLVRRRLVNTDRLDETCRHGDVFLSGFGAEFHAFVRDPQ